MPDGRRARAATAGATPLPARRVRLVLPAVHDTLLRGRWEPWQRVAGAGGRGSGSRRVAVQRWRCRNRCQPYRHTRVAIAGHRHERATVARRPSRRGVIARVPRGGAPHGPDGTSPALPDQPGRHPMSTRLLPPAGCNRDHAFDGLVHVAEEPRDGSPYVIMTAGHSPTRAGPSQERGAPHPSPGRVPTAPSAGAGDRPSRPRAPRRARPRRSAGSGPRPRATPVATGACTSHSTCRSLRAGYPPAWATARRS